MVMDENGRNGRKWHLAQQITHHVIIRILSITTTSTTCNQTTYHAIINDNIPTTNYIACNRISLFKTSCNVSYIHKTT